MPNNVPLCNELEEIGKRLNLAQARVLELGCGKAEMTRQIAERYPNAQIIATEIDRQQHAANLQSKFPPNIEFRTDAAQQISEVDASIDVVLMFKSLHHVPVAVMDQALKEIARVLKRGGVAWITEPVYAGPFNEILKLFHDEGRVRAAAFAAISGAIETGLFKLEERINCVASYHFQDFAEFKRRVIQVTHTQHQLDETLEKTVRERFEAHVQTDGAHFLNPMRIDVLRKL